MKKFIFGLTLGLVLSLSNLCFATYTRTYSFTNGTTADGSQLVYELDALGTAVNASLPLAGGALTGGITFSGITTDITSGTNEDIKILPNGTGDLYFSGDVNITNDTNTLINSYSYGTSANNYLRFYRGLGTAASPSAVTATKVLGGVTAWGYGATGFSSAYRAGIVFTTTEDWTDSAQGTYMRFYVTTTGGTTTAEALRISNDKSLYCLDNIYLPVNKGINFAGNGVVGISYVAGSATDVRIGSAVIKTEGNIGAGGGGFIQRWYDANTTNERMRLQYDGDLEIDGTYQTFSPKIDEYMESKGKTKSDATSKDYLNWALVDAKKDHKPYTGIPRVKGDDEEVNHSKGIFETQAEVDLEKDKYGKDISKIAIGTARWAEEAETRIKQLEDKITQLELEIDALKK